MPHPSSVVLLGSGLLGIAKIDAVACDNRNWRTIEYPWRRQGILYAYGCWDGAGQHPRGKQDARKNLINS